MRAIHPDIDRVLISEAELDARIRELGVQVSEDYRDKNPILVAVLKGAVYFMADFSRALDCEFTMDFMAVSSYGSNTRSSGVVRIVKDLDTDIRDRHVIVVEDIVDTGLTLKYLMRNFIGRGAASVEVVACLLKEGTQAEEMSLKYVGFTVPDEFVVGYGLDFAENFRGLAYIGVLKPEAYSS